MIIFLLHRKKINIIILFILVVFALNINAQDIKKEVTVIKSYQPSISDVSKINLMPVFNDTTTVMPVFQYSIFSNRLITPFQPRPVNVAKMVDEPIKNLYSSYLKLGFGNPFSPLAELSIANTRSKQNSICLFLRHYSADGNVKLQNDEKVHAPFSENEAAIYGKHLFKQSEIIGNVGYFGNRIAFYGYDHTLASLSDNDILQRYQVFHSNVAINSALKDSVHMQYQAGSNYEYLSDKYNFSDNHFNIDGKVGKLINGYYLGIGSAYDYYFSSNSDTITDGVLTIRPFISKSKGPWRFIVGLDAYADNYHGTSKFYTYPHINFEFVVAQDILSIFTGWEGHLEQNSLFAISNINPYVVPGLQVRNTNNKSDIFGGVKGNLSSSLQFMVSGTYSMVDDQYFFVNDTLILTQGNRLGNKFNVVYGNLDIFKLRAELNTKISNEISFSVKANYNNYNTYGQAKPWNLPIFEGSALVKYNLRDKIILTADAYFEGVRYGKDVTTHEPVALKSFADFNLRGEYRYNKILSFFLQFNNLTAAHYEWWSQYPVYRFRVMGGFTYSL